MEIMVRKGINEILKNKLKTNPNINTSSESNQFTNGYGAIDQNTFSSNQGTVVGGYICK